MSTLAEQIARAQAEISTWPPEVRASVRLEGGDSVTGGTAEASELDRIKRLAACGTVDSFMALPDSTKREFFAMAVQDSSARKLADERMAFLHSTNKDADGYEYGVCKVKHDAAGQIESFLWCLSDHSDIDAAIKAMAGAKS